MVIREVDVEGPVALKAKDDPPIGANHNRPMALKVALQLMQPEGRQPERLKGFRGVQHGQNLLDFANMFRVHAFRVVIFEELTQPFVREASDRRRSASSKDV